MNNSEPMLPNRHLSEYLRFYLSLENPPRFAVLLSGLWGAGKTYQVKRIVEDLLQTGEFKPQKKKLFGRTAGPGAKRYVLISLYGVKSARDIDDAMVAALYPWSTDDGIRIAASVAKPFLSMLK